MDRLEAMSMLVAVKESGSLSAASRALNVPLPTLSRKISDLEALLGARLLIRTTRSVTLTEAGQKYVLAAQHILEQVEDAERSASGEFVTPRGELVVTAPILFGRLHVLPVISDFLLQYPDINVRLILADRTLDLVADHVDVAVRIGALKDSSMIATKVGTMRTVLCMNSDLCRECGVTEDLDSLAKAPWVAIESPSRVPDIRLRDPSTGQQISPLISPRLSVSTPEAAVDAAIRKVGFVQLFHYQVVDAVRSGKVTLHFEDYEPEPLPVSLVHISRRLMPLKMRSFLDFATPRLQASIYAVAAL